MADIVIESQEEKDGSWEFTVLLDGQTHQVTLEETYYQDLTAGSLSPAELIERAFRFLLEREPKEAILQRFDLAVIERYFPEFSDKVKQDFK